MAHVAVDGTCSRCLYCLVNQVQTFSIDLFFSLFYLWLVCHLSWACLTAYISAVIAVSNCTLVTLKAHREIFRGPGLSFIQNIVISRVD